MNDLGYRLISFLGLLVMLGVAFLFSENRRKISLRIVFWGLSLQFILVFIILKTRPGEIIFDLAKRVFDQLIVFSNTGAAFLFGGLVTDMKIGAIVAFQALPIIIFISALAGVLFHLGITQRVVAGMAWIMQKSMRCSGAESLIAVLQVFMGIESNTVIPAYIRKMTRSEIFVVMTTFLASIASSVMGVYVSFGASAGHLLTASIMSAPAGILIAKMMIPETGEPLTRDGVKFCPERTSVNVIDAAATGAGQGVQLVLSIAAMLIAFIGLIALINFILQAAIHVSLQEIFGYLFAPFALVMGVPPGEVLTVGKLLGTKTVLNEFLAYQDMQGLVAQGLLSPRAQVISVYALCGFANFGSIAILIGGLGEIIPDRRGEVASLGIRALIAGTLSTFMTACFAGILI